MKLNLLVTPYVDLMWQFQIQQVGPNEAVYRVVPLASDLF